MLYTTQKKIVQLILAYVSLLHNSSANELTVFNWFSTSLWCVCVCVFRLYLSHLLFCYIQKCEFILLFLFEMNAKIKSLIQFYIYSPFLLNSNSFQSIVTLFVFVTSTPTLNTDYTLILFASLDCLSHWMFFAITSALFWLFLLFQCESFTVRVSC